MKKIVLSLIALFVIIGITGCKTKIQDEHGDSFEFSLYTNSSAKLNWNYKLSEEGIVDVSYKYDSSGCDKDSDGCGGQGIYTITALRPGKVTLSFECQDYNDTAIYEITVNDDLSILETHYGTVFEED